MTLTPERLEDLSVFLFELFASDLKVTKAQSVSVKKILRHYYDSTSENHSLDGFYSFIERNQENLLDTLKNPSRLLQCHELLARNVRICRRWSI